MSQGTYECENENGGITASRHGLGTDDDTSSSRLFIYY